MKLQKYSIEGSVVGEIELSETLFASEINDVLIYEYIKSANANLRQGTHSTKARSFVRGGGIKPWRQKGTGRARQGSIRAPQWRGGGVVFGPHPRSYRIELPKKIKDNAYRSIFSLKAKEGSIKVLEDFSVNGKTKDITKIAKALSLSKAVLITDNDTPEIKRSIRNIPWFKYNNMKRISGRDIFYSKELLITESAVKFLNEKYTKGDK
jgi:large subunit ribosomal protein L4